MIYIINLAMPFVRYAIKTTYFLENRFLIANDCHILYILSGTGKFESDNNQIRLKPNTLLYYPYGQPYRITAEQRMLFYTINFDFDNQHADVKTMVPQDANEYQPSNLIRSIPDNLTSFFSKIKVIPGALWVEPLLHTICEKEIDRSSYGKQIQSTTLLLVLYNFLDRKKQSENAICAKAKSLIIENLFLKNNQLAQQMHYHPYYLNEIFKMSEGMTLHQYINKIRIEQAYTKISTQCDSLESIALTCGFNSLSHFSTAFKDYYGFPPSTLRRKL